MFLSYATVPMFAFMILLNFFSLYSPIESAAKNGKYYHTCQDCLDDTCHSQFNRPCIFRNKAFYCVTCNSVHGNQQYYSEIECVLDCMDPGKSCVCNDECYVCVPNGAMSYSGTCEDPTTEELNQCT
ncbi:unnamed protein product [Macrosiphum euphorbiae]|uniref:Uncharacterized protein n=1 Tax=Macrosiphum euphorbiae TaxID=13131 RepID=A0AAV0XLJ8_9HEMI|nr:unnamed protein product [Macrosiphum euphorbiae]